MRAPSRDEVQTLLKDLRQLQEEASELKGNGYMDGFVDTFLLCHVGRGRLEK